MSCTADHIPPAMGCCPGCVQHTDPTHETFALSCKPHRSRSTPSRPCTRSYVILLCSIRTAQIQPIKHALHITQTIRLPPATMSYVTDSRNTSATLPAISPSSTNCAEDQWSARCVYTHTYTQNLSGNVKTVSVFHINDQNSLTFSDIIARD